MYRPSAFITITAVVALVFILASPAGEQFGVSPAYAQTFVTTNAVGTVVPEEPIAPEDHVGIPNSPPELAPFPPETFVYNNGANDTMELAYTCSGAHGGIIDVVPGQSLQLRNGDCADGCGSDCRCVECGLLQLLLRGTSRPLFTYRPGRAMFNAYEEAYGLDLVAQLKRWPLLNVGASEFDENGKPIPRWPIPIVSENRRRVKWHFTTIEPEFSVENGEVVIRARKNQSVIKDGQVVPIVEKGEIIGGPEGVTVNDDPE